jgi:hypothetical protein
MQVSQSEGTQTRRRMELWGDLQSLSSKAEEVEVCSAVKLHRDTMARRFKGLVQHHDCANFCVWLCSRGWVHTSLSLNHYWRTRFRESSLSITTIKPFPPTIKLPKVTRTEILPTSFSKKTETKIKPETKLPKTSRSPSKMCHSIVTCCQYCEIPMRQRNQPCNYTDIKGHITTKDCRYAAVCPPCWEKFMKRQPLPVSNEWERASQNKTAECVMS